jgi:hypothetical protein
MRMQTGKIPKLLAIQSRRQRNKPRRLFTGVFAPRLNSVFNRLGKVHDEERSI